MSELGRIVQGEERDFGHSAPEDQWIKRIPRVWPPPATAWRWPKDNGELPLLWSLDTSTNEIGYYRARAAAEHALAQSSKNSRVAGIHEQMAQLYEKLIPDKSSMPSALQGMPLAFILSTVAASTAPLLIIYAMRLVSEAVPSAAQFF